MEKNLCGNEKCKFCGACAECDGCGKVFKADEVASYGCLLYCDHCADEHSDEIYGV